MPSSSAPKVAPETKIILATTDKDVDTCFEIRVEVFVDEQKYPMETEIDDRDPHCVHLLLYANLSTHHPDESIEYNWQAVGTIRYDPKNHKLGRLAVRKTGRGYGYGRVLVQALHEYAVGLAQLKSRFAWQKSTVINVKAGAQVYVIPFYEKLGYEAIGELYLDEGQPHQMMQVTLPVPIPAAAKSQE